MTTRHFDLHRARSRAEYLWRGAGAHVPLSVAAATTFHRVQGSAKAIVTRADYDDALNIVAAALSRVIPIYALHDPPEGRKPVPMDFANRSFVRGATRLLSKDGSSLEGLTVRRSDLLSAVAGFRSSGLPLFLYLAGAPLAGVRAPPSPRHNRLLAALPEYDYARFAAHLELVPLRSQEVLFTERADLQSVHFPVSGVVSLLYITRDGEPTEIAVIGNEGVVGLALLLGGGSTPRRATVQIAGHAYRVKAEAVVEEFHRGAAFQSLLLRYVQALINQMAQTAVCNRHHAVEQQLCRWLLLSLDLVDSNEVLMTQELISQMLGVRRAGITEAARTLQQAGLIRYTRGRITVPDRMKLEARACECYAVVKSETDRLLPPPVEMSAASP